MSRESKFSGANGGKEYFFCVADYQQGWQPYAVDLYSAICDDHTCMRIYCSVYPQLPCYRATLGLLRARFGDLFSPSAIVRWVCNSRDSVLFARILLLQNVLGKSERNCLTSYLYNATILARFFIHVFKGALSSEFVD